jgi:hypothetical protein
MDSDAMELFRTLAKRPKWKDDLEDVKSTYLSNNLAPDDLAEKAVTCITAGTLNLTTTLILIHAINCHHVEWFAVLVSQTQERQVIRTHNYWTVDQYDKCGERVAYQEFGPLVEVLDFPIIPCGKAFHKSLNVKDVQRYNTQLKAHGQQLLEEAKRRAVSGAGPAPPKPTPDWLLFRVAPTGGEPYLPVETANGQSVVDVAPIKQAFDSRDQASALEHERVKQAFAARDEVVGLAQRQLQELHQEMASLRETVKQQQQQLAQQQQQMQQQMQQQQQAQQQHVATAAQPLQQAHYGGPQQQPWGYQQAPLQAQQHAPHWHAPPPVYHGYQAAPAYPRKEKAYVCDRCHQQGHMARNCTAPAPAPRRPQSPK